MLDIDTAKEKLHDLEDRSFRINLNVDEIIERKEYCSMIKLFSDFEINQSTLDFFYEQLVYKQLYSVLEND